MAMFSQLILQICFIQKIKLQIMLKLLNQSKIMSSQKIKSLTNTLTMTHRNRRTFSFSKQANDTNRSKAHSQRQKAKSKYEAITNCSKQQQKDLVREVLKARTPNWKHDYYRINKTFSLFPSQQVDPFPHNNEKYNTQFLERSLHGQSLKFPIKDWGYFQTPKDNLYSRHYRPIVRDKRKYNEDYQLRASLFGETWLDMKEKRANPFRTPVSNTFITTMRKEAKAHKI